MLNENIKAIRKAKGLSQQELAEKLNVVRQSVSKWEQGLSVPDSDMLVHISETLGTPVNILLGENIAETEVNDIKAIIEKLEEINMQFAQKKTTRRKVLHWLFISLSIIIVLTFSVFMVINSPYLGWNCYDPETAVLAVAFHSFEWMFIRIAPNIFIVSIIGAFLTRKKM